jgi:hypothetical protein
MRDHLASSSSESGSFGNPFTHVRQKIETSPGRTMRQASSAVKESTGAISWSSASRIIASAVCAERRAPLALPVVYRRSFSTSR